MLLQTLCTPLWSVHGRTRLRQSFLGSSPASQPIAGRFSGMSHAVCTNSGYEDRVIGCFLGALCADVLGASVEGWNAHRIQSTFKKGLTVFQDTDRGYVSRITAVWTVLTMIWLDLSACAGKGQDDALKRTFGPVSYECLLRMSASLPWTQLTADSCLICRNCSARCHCSAWLDRSWAGVEEP